MIGHGRTPTPPSLPSQTNTHNQIVALLDSLDSAMVEFYALAQLACEDAPQLVEMLEIVVDSSNA